MKINPITQRIGQWAKLLRWNKPSGRLILLIPAGWSLWLTPNAPPDLQLITLITIGGVLVSAAGCIANDLWDKSFDRKVARTKERPLAKGTVHIATAKVLLGVMLFLSLVVVLNLPIASQKICLGLALLALPPILLYPSAKRWFAYPQACLAICWGFSVLISWAASESNLSGGWPLLCCWIATLTWTFGFDTIYAMADRDDDRKLGLRSSALSLKGRIKQAVALSYGCACIFLAAGASFASINWSFWPIWTVACIGMQWSIWSLNLSGPQAKTFGKHFQSQVFLGGLLLLGLILGRLQ